MFTEGINCGRTLFRLAVTDAGGDNECSILSETVPHWVLDATVKVGQQIVYLDVLLNTLKGQV